MRTPRTAGCGASRRRAPIRPGWRPPIAPPSTPPVALGRVWGAVLAMAFAAAPVGIFATGWLAQNIGLRPTLGLFGGLYVLLICYVVRNRPLRGLADPAEARTPVSEDAATAG
ncbi:hypothetical protein C3492_13865 [Streptomyces sp. Ru62]|nr:hypothetical protein C3492_13865 [Streptomyces sp. Ru62]